MKKRKTVDQWRKEIAKKYSTSWIYVVNSNSFTDRGYAATRPLLGYERSPYGGRYTVYNKETYTELSK